MLQDSSDVVVGAIQCFQQIMFNLNVVVGPRNAQAGRGLKRAPCRVVQLLNECFQVCTHNLHSPRRCGSLIAPGKSHPRDPAPAASFLTSSPALIVDARPRQLLTHMQAHPPVPAQVEPLSHNFHSSKTSTRPRARDRPPAPAETSG